MRRYEGDEKTLGFMLQDVAKRNWNKVFLYYKDEKITYGQLDEGTNRIANTLINLGIKKGDRVGVMLTNCPDFVFMQFSVPKAGAIQVPINTEARGDLLAHFLNNSDPKVLLVDEQFLPLLKSVEHSLNKTPQLIIRGAKEKADFERKFETLSYQELFTGSPEPPQVGVSRIDPAAIFYTSGTTGVSKGVVLPHNHQWHFPAMLVEMGRITSGDRYYCCLPYYHGLAQFMMTVPALLAEASVALVERFSASRFWDEVRNYNCTACEVVYTIPSILMKQPERPDDADNPMRVVYTSGIVPEITLAFQKQFNVTLVEHYGSTEQNTLAYSPYGQHRPGAVGPINEKDFEIKIVDENDEELPRGKVGEMVSRAKSPWTRITEYWNMPEATVEVFRNQWLHSGDMGYIDEDGWLHFVSRGKDAIRRRGENISAFEFESVVVAHPAVKECAAIPIPSELGEDDVKVVVILREGEKLLPEELVTFCQERMAKYMVPRYIEFRESLPKTGTERVQKVKLKEEGLTPNTWDKERGDYIKNL